MNLHLGLNRQDARIFWFFQIGAPIRESVNIHIDAKRVNLEIRRYVVKI